MMEAEVDVVVVIDGTMVEFEFKPELTVVISAGLRVGCTVGETSEATFGLVESIEGD